MRNDIEYHVFSRDFMQANYGTYRRVVHLVDGPTVIQVSEEDMSGLANKPVIAFSETSITIDERKKNADFLKGMFG